MEPLHTRLGWINDNLMINQVIEKENLIKEMAGDITWGELAKKIRTRTGEIRKDFMETALDAGKQMAQTTGEMTRVLTAEIERTVKETFRMMQRIRKMDERLREWDEVMEDMENVLQEIRKKKQNITYQKGLAKNEFWRMEQEVDRELKNSEKRRRELQEKIEEEITKMRETNKRLKARLRTFKL
jgi:chromosome segregation ATPase